MRCPLALLKDPFVQDSLDLFAHYKNGITPQGRGVATETQAYRAVMTRCDSLHAEAESWYAKQPKKKSEGG